jgi:uncharacterized protein YdeI (YjbR/CyaY-like superfamily)
VKSNRNTFLSLPVLQFRSQKAWTDWLNKNQKSSTGVWLRIARTSANIISVSYSEALETALCYGWIDGQRRRYDDSTYLQRFTPRGERSIWSRINRGKAEELIRNGRMKPAGLQAVHRAQENGRWGAAYDSVAQASVPDDLLAALDKSAKAKSFFALLNSQNRYAILHRIQTAKKAETRAKRIVKFVRMLAEHKKPYP